MPELEKKLLKRIEKLEKGRYYVNEYVIFSGYPWEAQRFKSWANYQETVLGHDLDFEPESEEEAAIKAENTAMILKTLGGTKCIGRNHARH